MIFRIIELILTQIKIFIVDQISLLTSIVMSAPASHRAFTASRQLTRKGEVRERAILFLIELSILERKIGLSLS